MTEPSAIDRFLLNVAPQWALKRLRARLVAETIARHYEAAQPGRRTSGWHRAGADANSANGPALATLRAIARDLVRNNPWARRSVRVIGNHTVGWGIVAKPVATDGVDVAPIRDAWTRWAETKECDGEGRTTFYGLQRLVQETVVESGEALVRRRWRREGDGLSIPLQLQVLEPDFLDTSKDGIRGAGGGPIVQGVEYNLFGRREAYWLFEQHPGSNQMTFGTSPVSKRVPASEVLHVFRTERAGQVRGVSWFAPVVSRLKDYDEYEDATLMRQKIAACFAAFVTDVDGVSTPLGDEEESDDTIETIEPGLVSYLPPGKSVTFASPPAIVGDSFDERTLRAIAAGMNVTYEDLSQDYSPVNFSSARMARLSHYGGVHGWRWDMLIPQFCDPVWMWAMEALAVAGVVDGERLPTAEWTPPAMPMIEPDKEGLAYGRLVRTGAMTPSEMVREQGRDPETHWQEYAADMKKLDELGIVLDSDPRKVSQAGLTQERAGAGGGKSTPKDEEEARADAELNKLLLQVARGATSP